MYDYSVFGLHIRSEIELPELLPARSASTVDVTIRLDVSSDPEEKHPDADAGRIVLVMPDAGEYRIENGSEIIVAPIGGAPERNVRLYLLGSAFGALLHQRGMLPLHANAVEISGAAVAFMGCQGAGKSTLAAWFHDRGHRVLADDVCVIRFDDGRPMALPGLPRLRLWRDAIEATGRNVDAFSRSYVGDDDWNKFDVPVTTEKAPVEAMRLGGIYLLDRAQSFRIEPLTNLAAAEAIFEHTYRGALVNAVGGQTKHWEAAVSLVRNVPVNRVYRRWGHDLLRQETEIVLDHARQILAASSDR